MNHPTAKTIAVKGYLSPDSYLAAKTVFDQVGLSMSAAIGLSLQQLSSSIRQLDQTNRTAKAERRRMPRTGLHRTWPLSNARRGRGGAPKPPMRV